MTEAGAIKRLLVRVNMLRNNGVLSKDEYTHTVTTLRYIQTAVLGGCKA